jgi:hypothetical protein
MVGIILPLFITLGGAEYTTPIVWPNKKEYDPSETAYLYGYGFKPFTQINITIIRPDLVEDKVQTSTDEFGYFSCQYPLDGIHGIYDVTATDGVNVATTTFDNKLSLSASWDSQDSIYIYAKASGLSTSKQCYIKYFDPSDVEKRKSPTYTAVLSFQDNLAILPTFPNIFGYWKVKLYENDALKRTKTVHIDRIVWTTDSTYTILDTSFAQGETVYFKTMGLQSCKYYRFMLEMPNKTKIYVGSWTTGLTSMTGSYPLPSNAPLGTWILHVREADDASGTCEHHYVDCRFEVTTPPPPQQYYLTVRTDPLGIGTIPGENWYNACTLVNLTAPEFFPGPTGTMYRFNYWDVDGTPNATGVHEISVHMNANHTATAHYITQYFLNLTTNPPGVTTPAGVGWYDAGTNAPIFTPEFVSIVPGASRYRFSGWTTGDMSEIANASATSTTVFMDKAKTVTANYVIQYLVTFNQTGLDPSASGTVMTANSSPKNFSDLPYSFWVDNGTVVTYSYNNTVSSTVSGKRFSLINVTGLASPISVTSAVTVTGNYKTQYYLTVTSPYGTTGGEGWYNTSTTAYATLNTGVVDHGNGTRRVFTNWGGDASGTNYAQSNPIAMNEPKTAVANWKTQYKLTVRTNGLGTKVTNVYNNTNILGTATDATPFVDWFDQGTSIQLDIDSPINGSPTRYVFTQWTGDASGSSRPAPVTMSSPKDITANYKTQYELTFTHTGLDSSANTTVATVNGVPVAYGDLPYKTWVDHNNVTTYSYYNVSSSTAGKRFILINVTGPTSPMTVTSPVTVTGNYKTQFEVTFNQSGVGADFTGTVVTVDGTNYSVTVLPKPFWWNKDSNHTFSYHSPLVVDASKQYVWVSTSGLSTLKSGTLTITGSGSVIGNYVIQTKCQITFNQTGVSSDFTGTVVIIDGVNYNVTDLPKSFMWDTGSNHTFAFQAPLVVTPNVKQYVWANTTGLSTLQSGSIIVSVDGSITGNCKTQYQVAVIASPSGAQGGTFKVTYTKCGTVYSNVQKTTSWTEWVDNSTTVTVSEPQDIINVSPGVRYKFDSYSPSAPVTMTQAKTITLFYKTQYYLTVRVDPPGITTIPGEGWYNATLTVSLLAPPVSNYEFKNWTVDGSFVPGNPIDIPMDNAHTAIAYYTQIGPLSVSITPTTAKIKIGESVTFTSSVSGGKPPYTSYQWYLNGSTVSGATSPTWTFTRVTVGCYIVYLNVTDSTPKTAKSNEASVTVAPPLTVSISPTSASILVGQSVTFTSTVSGGYSPYGYQWYLGGTPVSGATSSSWTFTPTASGIYYVYLEVTDANKNTAQSETARIAVSAVPVGGYAISLTKQTPTSHMATYVMLIALFGIALSLTKRKRK